MEDFAAYNAKRRFPRRGFRKQIGILYQGQFWLGMGEELGEGGIGLNSSRPVPVGALVVLSFVIPGGEITVIRSEVKYNTEGRAEGDMRIGLQFLNFSFKYKKKIRDYIAAKSEAEAKAESGKGPNARVG